MCDSGRCSQGERGERGDRAEDAACKGEHSVPESTGSGGVRREMPGCVGPDGGASAAEAVTVLERGRASGAALSSRRENVGSRRSFLCGWRTPEESLLLMGKPWRDRKVAQSDLKVRI